MKYFINNILFKRYYLTIFTSTALKINAELNGSRPVGKHWSYTASATRTAITHSIDSRLFASVYSPFVLVCHVLVVTKNSILIEYKSSYYLHGFMPYRPCWKEGRYDYQSAPKDFSIRQMRVH